MKIKRLKFKVLTLLIIFILGFGWVYLAGGDIYAEGGGASIFVSPMKQEIILVPGEVYTGSVTVSNGSSATAVLEYEAKVGSYAPVRSTDGNDDYGGVDVNTVNNRNIMMDWINLSRSEGTVAPNEKEIIEYTIKVPKTAPAGAQYASILITEKDKESTITEGSAIKSKTQLASAIIANVAGETIEKGAIKYNEMPTMLTDGKLEATSMVRNDGNIYTDASYTLQVWPMGSDEEICTNEEKADSTTVLPDTERYHVQTCDLPAVGIFKAKQVVKIFSEESVLEKTIFVCPIWLMVLVLIVVVGIVVGIIIYIKKRKSAKEDD